jgi:hypothetical protein
MKNDIITMAIKKMDHLDLVEKFRHLNSKGMDSSSMMQFLNYMIPQYELEKRVVLTEIIDGALIAVVDCLMEDPLNTQYNSQLSQLKQIAQHLNIEIDALRKRT